MDRGQIRKSFRVTHEEFSKVTCLGEQIGRDVRVEIGRPRRH